MRASQRLAELRNISLPLILFSFVTNLSVLASPLFMMHVLDRVVPSGNINTLLLLMLLVFTALIVTAVVEYFRDQAFGRVSEWLENSLSGELLASPKPNGSVAPLRDISQLRNFFGTSSASTLLDIPWIPLFLCAIFLIHPAFLLFIAVASGLTFLSTWLANTLATPNEDAEKSIRQAGMAALAKMDECGQTGQLMSLNENLGMRYLASLDQAKSPAAQSRHKRNTFDAIGRLLRGITQIGSLSLGAFLVTQGALSAGGMIGASILLGKCNGIIEAALRLLGQREQLMEAIQRLDTIEMAPTSHQVETVDLSGNITVVDMTVPGQGGRPPRLERMSFRVKPGECVAIMGESGSGKSTLIEAMTGISPAPIGNCFLDETDVRTLGPATRNNSLGYVPQSGHIFPGTIAENIARFSPDPDDERVLDAAKLAGVHGLISSLPDAYETDLGAFPHALPAGQKQRIAFARALYERPKYLFMDEPNALLDHHAERQMADAIYRLKAAGTTIVMSAHRLGIVNLADRIIVLDRGKIVDMGPRAEIMGRVANAHRRLRLPISGGALQDLTDWVARQFVRDGDEDLKMRAATIATELYLFLSQNGPDDADRFLSLEFKFINDNSCSITISEPRTCDIEETVTKVANVVSVSRNDAAALNGDEKSLATVLQLSENLDHQSEEDFTALCALIVREGHAKAKAG